MSHPTKEPIFKRLESVREDTGLTQLQFLPRLNQAAAKLGVREYSQSTLSKLETGAQVPVFDDVAVYAAVDPKGRGKLWLAWGDAIDSTVKVPAAQGATEVAARLGLSTEPLGPQASPAKGKSPSAKGQRKAGGGK